MADPPAESENDTGARPAGGSITGPPRWVKAFGVLAAVTLALLVVLLLTHGPGGGGHGPGLHGLPAGVTDQDAHQP